MARSVALLATLLFLLAGCASTPSAEDQRTASTAPETFTVTGDNRIGPLFTDTYHFLAQPSVTPNPPDAYEPVRVPVTSIYDRTTVVPPAEPPTWDFALPQDLQGIVGTATVWVEVQGTVTGNPFARPPTNGCFWSLDAIVNGELVTLGCLNEDLQVDPGIYELQMAFSHPDMSFPAGTEFHVEFETGEWVERTPGTTVEMLTASIQYDSVLQIYGLELPLGEALLATT